MTDPMATHGNRPMALQGSPRNSSCSSERFGCPAGGGGTLPSMVGSWPGLRELRNSGGLSWKMGFNNRSVIDDWIVDE